MTLKGIIYRIEHKIDPDIRYIGSTLNELRYRWRDHKIFYKRWVNKKSNKKFSIYPYFEKYGIESFCITEIKQYAVCDRTHLKVYEQLWMNKLKCINIQPTFGISYLTLKKYREEHKEEIAERMKQYYEENKEEIAEKKKKYREANKEAIAERKRKYYEENKEEIAEKKKKYGSEKVECSICQCLIRRDKLLKHTKSKKHQDNLAKLEEEKSKE